MTDLVKVDDSAVRADAADALQRAQALTVVDVVTYEQAGGHVTGLRALSKSIEAFFEEPTKLAHAAWKSLTTKRAGLIDPIEAQVKRLGRDMAAFMEAERRRQEAEAAAAQRAAAAAAQAAALEEAATLEREGLSVEAVELLDQALEVAPMPVIERAAVPKVAGVSYTEVWEVDQVDESRVPREYMAVDYAKIRNVVKHTKGTVVIPGVTVVKRMQQAVRGR
jgi:hypothetical protein